MKLMIVVIQYLKVYLILSQLHLISETLVKVKELLVHSFHTTIILIPAPNPYGHEDVDENQITQEPKQETKQEQIKQEPTREPTQETKQDVTQDTAQDTKPSYRTAGIRVLPQKGWRSYISYL